MTENNNPIDSLFNDKLSKEYQSMLFDVKYDKENFKDPEFLGLLLFRLVKEREASNKMLKEILESLSQTRTSSVTPQEDNNMVLSEVDEKIVTYIRKKGKADAEEIQGEFSYRGKNAASARLNALFEKKVLKKGRAGKKVIYWASESS